MKVDAIIKEGEKLFKEFVEKYQLEGIVASDMEGLTIASYYRKDIPDEIVASASAAIISAFTSMLADMGKSSFTRGIAETPEGNILIEKMDDILLIISAPKEVKLGALMTIAKKLKERLEKEG